MQWLLSCNNLLPSLPRLCAGWKEGTKVTFAGKGDELPGRPPQDLVFVVQQVRRASLGTPSILFSPFLSFLSFCDASAFPPISPLCFLVHLPAAHGSPLPGDPFAVFAPPLLRDVALALPPQIPHFHFKQAAAPAPPTHPRNSPPPCDDPLLSPPLSPPLLQIPHPHFKRQGDDLVVTVGIRLDKALAGGTIDVPTLDNRILRIPLKEVVTPK